MADRTVVTRLRLDVKAFSTGAGKAQRDLSGLNKKMADTAGFAKGMRKALEDATKRLPVIEIDANSTPAEIAIANVRARLETLSGKEIGVDIDATAALVEMAALQAELEELEKGSSFQVRADIGQALGDLQKIVREVERVDGQSVEIDVDVRGGAFAQKLRAQVEAAARSLPAIPIGADSGPAERAVDALRSRLEALSGRTVGVDVDAASAMAEIREIEAQLAALAAYAPTIDVRADAGAALAQLQAVDSQVSRLDGRTANVRVNADTAGALAALAAVSAAIAAIPSVASVTVGVAGLGAAFGAAAAGAGAFAAAVVPGVGRVNEALKQAETAAGGAGGAVKSAGEKAAEAAAKALRLAEAQDRVKDAAQGVKDAQQRVRDALADVGRAKADVAVAAENAAARQADAARRIEDAERAVQEAHRATQRAVEDLTRARERAQERLEDLALATERGALSEERAKINIERARADLARVQADPKASALDRADADLRLREAELALREIQERNGDLAKERADADRKGVEGSDEVVAAKERILQAQQREADAERNLADARANAARVAVEGQRQIAAANERVAQAQRKVSDAQQQVIRAQRDAQRAAERYRLEQLQAAAATSAAGGAAGGAASKMAKLSKEERKLAEDIKDFKEAYEDWQRSLQPDLFPVLSKGMDLVAGNLDRISPLARAAGEGFDRLLEDAKTSLEDDVWDRWIADLSQRIPGAITSLGHIGGNTFKGLTGAIVAFLPTGQKILDWLEDGSEKFADWGTNLKGSPEFERFLAYAAENGPKVVEIVGNLVELAAKLAEAGAAPGQGLLDLLAGISERLANLSPQQLQAIATGIGLIWGAANLGKSVKWAALALLADLVTQLPPAAIYALAGAIAALKTAMTIKDLASGWAGLRGEIGKTGDAADKAKGKVGGLLDKLGGLSGAGLAGGAIAGGLAAAWGLDELGQELSGLNVEIGKVREGLLTLASGGALSGEAKKFLEGEGFGSIGNTLSRLAGGGTNLGAIQAAVQKSSDNIFIREAGEGPLDALFGSSQLESIQKLDEALAQLVSAGNVQEAQKVFQDMAKAVQENGGSLDRLRDLFPQYTQAAATATGPTGDMAKAAENAASKIGSADQALAALKGNLDIFNGRTDIARATLELKDSFEKAKDAIDKANGNLDLSKAKTDSQREAVVLARDQFAGYITKVTEIADAQKKVTGSTGEASSTIAEQLPKLFDLAGKNREAKEQVLLLAEAYGISRQDALKAAKGGEELREVLAKIKSKSVRIDADTKPALDTVNQLITTISGKVIRIGVDIRSEQQEHGARRNADGNLIMGRRVMAFAGGSEKHVAQIARPGEMRLWAEPETGGEAYIPLAAGKRGRSEKILRAVAEQFGLAVLPVGDIAAGGFLEALQAARFAAGGLSPSSPGGPGGSGSGSVSATLGRSTNTISATLLKSSDVLRTALDTGSVTLSGAVGDAWQRASAGLVTTSTNLSQAWDRAAKDMSGSITQVSAAETEASGKLVVATGEFSTTVKTQVKSLEDAVASVAKAVAKKAASSDTDSVGGEVGGSSKSKATAAAAKSKSKATAKKPATSSVGGYVGEADLVLREDDDIPSRVGPSGSFARGGIRQPGMAVGPVALMGEAGHPEAFIPYDPAHRGRAEGLVRQVAADFGMTSTRQPTYQRSTPSVTYQRGASGGGAGGPAFDQKAFFAELRQIVSSAGVSFPNATIKETVDIDQLMQRAAWKHDARPTA